MSAVHVAHLTTLEVEEAFRAAELAILPVGAIEQHGPHLSVQTDARIAEAFATRLADELAPTAVLWPLVPYGLSEHHANFPGTMTLTPRVYHDLILDLISSLASAGFSKVVIVNGHGGNIDALSLIGRQARVELGVQVASMMWARLAADVCAEVAVGDAYGHACENETSLAMALAPELVRAERITAPADRPPREPHAAPPRAKVDLAVSFEDLTPDGVYGDPRHASQEAGERILDVALGRAVQFCRAFTKSDER